MISSAAFSKLRTHEKQQRILEGIEHINAQYAQMAVTVKKLNAWLEDIAIDEADKKYLDRFQVLTGDGQYKADLLTEQILISSQRIRHITDRVVKQLINGAKQD